MRELYRFIGILLMCMELQKYMYMTRGSQALSGITTRMPFLAGYVHMAEMHHDANAD